MKKTLLIAGMIAAPISMAVARNITIDTAIRWNTNVIEQALNATGIISNTYSDVGSVHYSILNALLKMDTFSARDAIEICMNECNKSEMLREGKGKSGKKCPQLCDEFASSLVIANNDLLTGNTERQKVAIMTWGYTKPSFGTGGRSETSVDVITTFKDDEHDSKHFCKILTDDAFNRGLKYPMICGGACDLWGQDLISVYSNAYDGGRWLYYEVGDFCDGLLSSGESYWVVHADGTIKKIKNQEGRDSSRNAIDKTYRK
ncbi:hypothetical protein HDR61_01960 [bacterium]|nr:hypothetical protein [bacterium]